MSRAASPAAFQLKPLRWIEKCQRPEAQVPRRAEAGAAMLGGAEGTGTTRCLRKPCVKNLLVPWLPLPALCDPSGRLSL